MADNTVNISGSKIASGNTLVGDSGGLSLIYETSESSIMLGLLKVDTEHGSLYLDPEKDYEIIL
jgi:hypothetical protein